MPRVARQSKGDFCYHVMNRGNERQQVFYSDKEYDSFVQLMRRAALHQPVRLLADCVMPNHFHFCVQPFADGDLGRYMHWLTTTHVAQFRKSRPGVGHVWQGRYKALPVQPDFHLMRVIRYIERNPLRATLAQSVSDWHWSSARQRLNLPLSGAVANIADLPIKLERAWQTMLESEPEEELAELRASLNAGIAFGDAAWASSLK